MPSPQATAVCDAAGLPLSTSAAARDAYVDGVARMLAAGVGAQQSLAQALQIDPDFALAHIAHARLLWTQMDAPGARRAADLANRHPERLTRRERQHVAMLTRVVHGQPAAALALARDHLAEFPRDAMVIAPCTNVFGLFGFSGRQGWEHELVAFLEPLAPAWVDDGWFASLFAFALGEVGQHQRGLALAQRALALAPHNGHAAHALAHLLYELDRPDEAIDFLDGWLPGYPQDAQLFVHLNWHLALSHLSLGRHDQAWAVYRGQVHASDRDGPAMNILTDSAAFLWRAELAGTPVARNDWLDVADYAAARFPQPGQAFVDVHRAMGCAALGDQAALASLRDTLQQLAGQQTLPAGAMVAQLVQAFGWYRAGRWQQAAGLLRELLDQLERIGGSRAQRDLVLATCLDATRRAMQPSQLDRLMALPRMTRLAAHWPAVKPDVPVPQAQP